MSFTRSYPVPPAWRPVLLALFGLIACVLLLYRETALAMVSIWSRSETFTHAFTVPPIVAWLIWRQRDALATQVPRASAWMLWPVGIAALIWLLGDLAATNAVTQLAFTALLVLVAVAVLGVEASRCIAFPLAFLFFSVPIGEFLMPQMMQWTADFTILALRLSGIPVFREGLQFVIPSGNWSVVEACSGVRYLIASVMVGVLFAYLNYQSTRRRLIFIAVSIAVPVVANWVRAYLIVMLGHLSGNVLATGADHLIYGWVFFGIVITLMFVIGARWSEMPSVEKPISEAGQLAMKARIPQSRLLWAVAIGAAVLMLAPHAVLWSVVKSEIAGAPVLTAPAALAKGWRASEQPVANWKPAFGGAAAEFNRTYSSGSSGSSGAADVGLDVGLYVGYYRHQDHAQKLVSSDNALVKSNDVAWSQVSTESRPVLIDGSTLTVRSTQLRDSGHASGASANRLVAWQFYWVNGTLTSSDQWAKAYAALYRLMGRGDDAAVVIVYARADAAGGADALLASFLQANLPDLKRRLASTRQGE